MVLQWQSSSSTIESEQTCSLVSFLEQRPWFLGSAIRHQTSVSQILSQKLLMQRVRNTGGFSWVCSVTLCVPEIKAVVEPVSVLEAWTVSAVALICGCVLAGLILWQVCGCGLVVSLYPRLF